MSFTIEAFTDCLECAVSVFFSPLRSLRDFDFDSCAYFSRISRPQQYVSAKSGQPSLIDGIQVDPFCPSWIRMILSDVAFKVAIPQNSITVWSWSIKILGERCTYRPFIVVWLLNGRRRSWLKRHERTEYLVAESTHSITKVQSKSRNDRSFFAGPLRKHQWWLTWADDHDTLTHTPWMIGQFHDIRWL